MRRVRLVTEEMLQWFAFNAAAPLIDAAIARGSFVSAKRRIKTLMKKFLEKPSEQTIDLFIEMHHRWHYYVEIFEYLEANWENWVTWEDRMEILWQKFRGWLPGAELIQATYSSMQQIDPQNCGIGGKQYLRWLINRIIEFKGNYPLCSELLKIVELRYGAVMNIPRYIENYTETRERVLRPPAKPLSPEQIRAFWRRNTLNA